MKHGHESFSGMPPLRPIYFISDRPEAYEVSGEIGHEEAELLAQVIARHAAERFPGIEFRIDSIWHTHGEDTKQAAEYIEAHWQDWAAAMSHGQMV